MGLFVRNACRCLAVAAAVLSASVVRPAPVLAKEVSFEATLDRRSLSVGEAGRLNLTFFNTQNIPSVEIPDSEAFRFRYLGPSTSVSIINGNVSSSVTHMYSIVPLKSGVFPLGPFEFQYGGDTYRSNALSLEVAAAGQSPAGAANPDGPQQTLPQDVQDRVFLVMEVGKKTAYKGEVIPVKIKLYVNRLAIRDIQFPELSPQGFSAAPFAQPKQYREVVGGMPYEVIEFESRTFALRPGELILGPAVVKCNLVVQRAGRRSVPSGFEDFFDSDAFENFFGRYETVPLELKSPEIPVTIKEVPLEAAPQGYEGSIGDFTLEVAVSAQTVKAGDPVTVTMTVGGAGNSVSVKKPVFESEEGFKIYPPRVEQKDNATVFEQVLIPLSPKVSRVPAVSLTYFDTKTETFQTLRRGPFPLTVEKSDAADVAKVIDSSAASVPLAQEEILGRDIIYIKTLPGPFFKRGAFWYRQRSYWFAHLVPVAAAAVLFFYLRLRRKMSTDRAYARRVRAPRRAQEGLRRAERAFSRQDAPAFYDAVFQTMQECIASLLNVPPQGITESVIDERLRETLPHQMREEIREAFRQCDAARYTGAGSGAAEMGKTLERLRAFINAVSKRLNSKS